MGTLIAHLRIRIKVIGAWRSAQPNNPLQDYEVFVKDRWWAFVLEPIAVVGSSLVANAGLIVLSRELNWEGYTKKVLHSCGVLGVASSIIVAAVGLFIKWGCCVEGRAAKVGRRS